MTTLFASWLAADQGPPADVAGIHVPVWSAIEQAPFPTRRTEFRWAAQQLVNDKDRPEGFAPEGSILDAGAGFNPEIHLFPTICTALGFDVMAVDMELLSLTMPPLKRVLRYCGDLCDLPFPDASYDYWVCISVLEHMPVPEKERALKEAYRLLKSGGLVILTTDETHPAQVNEWLADAGFDIGPLLPFKGEHLSPRVAAAVGRKP